MVDIQPSDAPLNSVAAPLAVASSETVGSKRQRRPSVRLGDIGGHQPYDSHFRRSSSSSSAAASKHNNVETEEKYSGGEDNDDFELENSESPMKDHSPIHSLDNLLVDGNEREVLYHGSNHRRPIRTRVSDGVELSGPSDTEMRRCEEDAVRIWLNSLGLGRYAPVFKIHEVDDEILPLLTLEDLKDMGINAVGSRRKMFCAIQKLGKGFS
ncbi:hypothetical protein Gotri_026991 [Gossypium trilobum]|uniref:SAM domain-containing protein n=1 Tax=Gossypium trilobum TaxID=34281 RepID=A0A7J9FTA8_9ROSI|nr:hypothetical protein [Gossypium trilobum]